MPREATGMRETKKTNEICVCMCVLINKRDERDERELSRRERSY